MSDCPAFEATFRQRGSFCAYTVASDEELPYLFCSCSLKEDKPEESESVPTGSANASTSGGQDVEEEFSNLIGNLVRNSHRVPDLEGNPGSFFVFEDMSVRTTGTYTLEFRLGEA